MKILYKSFVVGYRPVEVELDDGYSGGYRFDPIEIEVPYPVTDRYYRWKRLMARRARIRFNIAMKRYVRANKEAFLSNIESNNAILGRMRNHE